jgi:hypothetical protein
MISALRSKERQNQEQDELKANTELALSLASQMQGDLGQKQKTCEFLKEAIEWIGNDADAMAKRTAMILAAQCPENVAAALATVSIASSIILALFGADAGD